jgi:segregation and condensation protein A
VDSYKIKLPQFEGPFDLLLFFIQRDELDIYDIPIAKITDNFLDYIQKMRELNIEVASEFILVASKLMNIKARTLLPRKEYNEEGEEIDPREELINRLVEYKLYKEVSGMMQELEEERTVRVQRGNIEEEARSISDKVAVEAEMESVSLYKLMRAYERVMKKKEPQQQNGHVVYNYPYTMEEERESVYQLVHKKGKVSAEQIFEQCKDRLQGIFTFLALLEMVHQRLIDIKVGTGYNSFIVSAA